MSGETGQKVRSDLSSAGIKGKNAALNEMAYTKPVDDNGNKNTVDSIASNGSTYTALTDAELAGQSEGNLQNAIDNNGLSQERAQRIQSNDNVWSQLSGNKMKKISRVAGTSPTTSSASASTQNAQPGTAAQSPIVASAQQQPPVNQNPPAQQNGQLNVPHGNNAAQQSTATVPTQAPPNGSAPAAPAQPAPVASAPAAAQAHTQSPSSIPRTTAPRTSQPTGTSNYTQTASGIHVPPSANNTPRPPTP